MTLELDPAAIERVLRLGGRNLLQRLVITARGNMRGRLDEIEESAACEPPDFVRIERAAHSLKSSAAYLGAEELRGLALAMEVLARNLESADAGEIRRGEVEAEMGKLLDRTRQVFTQTSAALEKLETENAAADHR